jgi:hypothetical protein
VMDLVQYTCVIGLVSKYSNQFNGSTAMTLDLGRWSLTAKGTCTKTPLLSCIISRRLYINVIFYLSCFILLLNFVIYIQIFLEKTGRHVGEVALPSLH